MTDKEIKQHMTDAYQQMAGETFAMSQQLGGSNTLHVLAAVVAYAMLVNRSRNEAENLDHFRKEVEQQMTEMRPQMEAIIRIAEEQARKAGE